MSLLRPTWCNLICKAARHIFSFWVDTAELCKPLVALRYDLLTSKQSASWQNTRDFVRKEVVKKEDRSSLPRENQH